MKLITFIDKNEYVRKKRVLQKYFKKTNKYLVFEVIPKLKEQNKIDGVYQVELPTDKLFEKVYGKIVLKFSVQNDIAIIETIEPNEILTECYRRELPCYNGIPYANSKDLTKIKIMEKLICE